MKSFASFSDSYRSTKVAHGTDLKDFASFMLDPQGCVANWNPGATQLTGYSPEEIIGQNHACLYVSEDVSKGLPINTLELARNHGQCAIEGLRKCQNGTLIYVAVITTTLFDIHNNLIGYAINIRSISEYQSYDQLLKTIIESAPVPLLMVNQHGLIQIINQRGEQLFGYQQGELLTQPIEILMPVRFHEKHVHSRNNYMHEPISRTMGAGLELIGKRKNGSEFPLEVGLGSIQIGEEKLIMATVYDTTDRKHSEALLMDAKIKSEAASRAKSDFLANMSHEIRTPMNAIIGLTQLTLETELTFKQRDHLRKVFISSKALLRILNDILDYSKIEAGKLDIEQVEFALEDVIRTVSDLFSARITEKCLELFLEINHELKNHLIGDPLRLGQVLNNLVDNAIKYTLHGEVHLKVELLQQTETEIQLQFSVRDTGIGMNKIEVERLFHAFSQADTSITRKYGGTGLGLTISKRLVEMMGGEFSLNSTPDEGSVFAFTAWFGLGGHSERAFLEQELYGARILIVDDQETSLVILEQYLRSWQFDVTCAISGEDALELVLLSERESRPYEVLLVDWKMPGMDGLKLAGYIKNYVQAGKIKKTPTIIMVTAFDKELLLSKDNINQLDSILVKPVTPSGLFSSLWSLQNPKSGQRRFLLDRRKRVNLAQLAAPIKGANILLVEDNDINKAVALEILSNAGLQVSIASNGVEAVYRVQQMAFDAVLMDLQMPIMDGFEAAKIIRTLPEAQNIPIIALSAAVTVHDLQASEMAGMNGHIAKPIDQEQLIVTLLNHIKPLARNNSIDDKLEPEPCLQVTNDQISHLPVYLPEFDLSSALGRLNNNQELLSKLLLRFSEDYAKATLKIDEMLLNNEKRDAVNLLHRISGAAANLGAGGLAEIGRQFEREIQSEQSLVSRDGFYRRLNTAVIAIQKNINPVGKLFSVSQGDTSKIEIGLAKLTASLKQRTMLTDEVLSQLCAELAGHVSTMLITDLDQQLHNFDFTAAEATVAKIIKEYHLQLPNG